MTLPGSVMLEALCNCQPVDRLNESCAEALCERKTDAVIKTIVSSLPRKGAFTTCFMYELPSLAQISADNTPMFIWSVGMETWEQAGFSALLSEGNCLEPNHGLVSALCRASLTIAPNSVGVYS